GNYCNLRVNVGQELRGRRRAATVVPDFQDRTCELGRLVVAHYVLGFPLRITFQQHALFAVVELEDDARVVDVPALPLLPSVGGDRAEYVYRDVGLPLEGYRLATPCVMHGDGATAEHVQPLELHPRSGGKLRLHDLVYLVAGEDVGEGHHVVLVWVGYNEQVD